MFGRFKALIGKRKKPAKKQAEILRYEELEPRVLFAADIMPGLDGIAVEEQVLAADASITDQLMQAADAVSEEQAAAAERRELVIVSPNVPDYKQLTADLQDSDANRLIDVLVLAADRDGIEQVSEILTEYEDLAAVHFIAHGADGQINLGNSWINAASLQEHSESIAAWGSALNETGDLLFYGCNIAADSAGQNLLNDIARLTGADVAASDDLTGSPQSGADWVLEYDQGRIESALALSSETQQSWSGVLAANNPPTVALSNTTTSISEAADTTSRTKVADITVTDDAPGTNVLSLAGTDAGLFEIESGALYLKAGANLDFETNAQLDVTVQVNDAALSPSPNDTAALSITVTDANDPPALALSNTTVSISEAADTTSRIRVADITVTDDALGSNLLSLSGTDAGLFEIDAGVLYLKAGTVLDHETNAQLDVTVQVDDATLAPEPNDTAALSITVTDANDPPTVALSNATTTISEAADTGSRIQVADITVSDDALGANALSLAGADAALFEIESGMLYLKAGAVLDFETNAQLDVTVQVNDATLAPDPNHTAVLSITVTDGNDPPVITSDGGNATAAVNAAENQTSVTTVSASDSNGDTPTYSITGGADAALFDIDPGTGVLTFKAAPDFEVATDADANGVYEVQVTAADGNGGTDVQTLSVTVTDAGELPAAGIDGGPYTIDEGDPVTLDASASTDPDGDALTYAWDLDNDGQFDDAVGVSPTLTWAQLQALGITDDGVYNISVEVDDAAEGTDTAATTLTVGNTAPALTISGESAAADGGLYTLNLSAADPGDDTITGWTINWGDGTIETINGNPSSVTHTYTGAGRTFNILAAATDEDGTYLQNQLLVPTYAAGDSLFRFEATTGEFLQEFATADGLDNPVQAITGPDGNIYVSGEASNNVLRYNAITGEFIDTFVSIGSGGLSGASGMAFGADGNLYVSSYGTNEVLRYDGTSGDFIDAFVTAASGGLSDPYGLAIGPDGNLYVCSYSDSSVLRYNGSTGAFMDVFVSAGSGGLNTPENMIFGPDGNIYIASYHTNEVLRYNGTTGQFIDTFISAGLGGLNGPAGLAFGPDGNLYVSDYMDAAVLRYNGTTGGFIDEYVSTGSGGLTSPSWHTFIPKQQVTVTRAPVISGTSAGQPVNDNATVTPFAAVTITDADPGETVTVTVTLSDGDDNGTFSAASLGASGFTKTGSGEYSLSDATPAAARSAIRQLVFDPTENQVAPGSTVTTTFTIEVDDGDIAVTDTTTTVIATSINDAPTVSGTFIMTSTDESTASAAVQVSAILADAAVSANDPDGDTLGMAVVDQTGLGTWQYSLDGAGGWTGLGPASADAAVLLSETTWLRYVPDGANGETAGLDFCAWDQTAGAASTTGSPSVGDTTPGGGTAAYSAGTGAVALTVTEINDGPTVALSNTTTGISETADTSSRIQVADITVTDDAPGTNVLSLTGADAGLFEIEAGVLYLKAGATLDYETNPQLDVTVQVNDTTLAPDPNDTAALSITVSDVNDPPTVALSNTTTSISEAADTSSRTRVADITVTDDALGSEALSLAGADADLFEIDTGVLYLKAGASLDFEANPQLDVIVQVNDATLAPDPDDTAALNITVTDANDPPTLTLSNTMVSISEGADTSSRTRVADLTVIDDASGTNVLSLAGVDAGLFEIDAGVLYLKAGASLDLETNPQLDVIVQVNDATLLPDPNDTAALNITVTDANDPPTVALSNTTTSISEAADTSTRTKVADITVTDDTLGSNLLSLSGTHAGLFEIDAGVLYLKAGTVLDYETNAQLDVTVQVDDATLAPDPNDTAALSITVTDANEAPTVALSNTTISISEAADTSSRIQVADITVTDDALGANALSLSGADAALFEIDAGVLYLKAGATLDYETNPQLDVTVQVNDATLSPSPNDKATLNITVTDANDPPTVALSNTTTSISEAADTSTRIRVADITVTDDALGTNVLSLSGMDAGLFEIDAGVLYLKAGAVLDYETNAQLDVTVQVNDAALAPDPNDTAVLSLTVTDANEAPTVALSNTTSSISEAADTTSRIQVADITVTDDALGTNALSLAGVDAALFEIDAGVLYLKAGAALDYETNAQLDVTVQVNDATLAPDPNGTAALSITVSDGNDAPTVVLSNTTTSISEAADTTTRIQVADVTVIDDALGTETLSLSGADAGLFEIDAGGLYLKAGTVLDYETNAQLDVTVQVNDAALAPDPNDTAALSITVTDANEAPTVALSNTTTSISEGADTTSRTQVADITVTDDALGTNALSLAGADAGLFEIDAGVLYLKAGATLDYETNPQLDVSVQVNDAAVPPSPNDTADLSISVSNANDPPTINAPAGYDVDEDADYRLLPGISIADVDAGGADLSVALEVANGVLRIGNTAGLKTISGNSSASVVLQGAVADLNAALESLSYRPNPDFSGSDDPLVTVNDLGNTGPGGPQIASERVSLVVNPVNDPGQVTIDNLTPVQGDTLTASVADADGAGGSIAYQWYRDGVPIEGATAAAHTTTQDDVDKVITVTADYTDDVGSVESLTSAGSAPVINVNDAPVLGNNRLSIGQGATVTLDSSMLSATDVDHPDGSLVFNVSGVTAGYFALASDPSTPITSFNQSEISAGNVVFVHDGSEVQPGYSVSVSDGFDSTTASPASIGFILPIPKDTVLTLPDDIPPATAANEIKPEPPVDAPLSNGSDGQIAVTGDTLGSISGVEQHDVAYGTVVFIQESSQASPVDSFVVRPEDSGRNDVTASRPRAFFSYQRLKLLLSAQNSGELQSALRNLNISTLSSSDYALVRNSLDAIRQEISNEIQLGKTVLGSAIAATIGLSAGYVVWLLKGGSLLASVLSSMPAWQLTDPMAILAGKNGNGREEDDGGDDDESLETIIDDGAKIDQDKKKKTSELKNLKTGR